MKSCYWRIIGILVTAAPLILGCGTKEEAKKPAPAAQSDKTEKENEAAADDKADINITPPNPDEPPVLTEAEIEKAKKRAKDFMKKFGPKIIADMAHKNVLEFRGYLAKGRKLVKEKKYDEAISAFREALATKPNDARTLSEIAKIALLQGNLAMAEASILLGIGRVYDPRIKAHLAQLLKEIHTKQGKPAVTLSAKTERIGSATSAVGPEANLAGLCLRMKKVIPKDVTGIECDPAAATIIKATSGPLKKAAYLPVISAKTERHMILAVETAAGWFAVAELAQLSTLKNLYAADDKFEVKRFEFEQLIPGGAEEIIIDFRNTINDSDPGINEQIKHTFGNVLVCGIKDKTPACMIRIPYLLDGQRNLLSESADKTVKPEEHTQKLPVKYSYALKVEFDKAGKVNVTKFQGEVPADRNHLVGKHAL